MGPTDLSERRSRFEDTVREELLPDLEVVRRLGGGPLSTVFLAREPELQRLVAVKVLHPEATRRKKAMARFRREARALARVSHPCVVSVFRVADLGSEAPYLVMQYVPGISLAERLARDGPLSLAEACHVLEEVASALSAVHSHGIVHRDVRPESVLLGEADDRVLLADFGLAAFLSSVEAPGQGITTTGHLVTDLEYSAPEYLAGEEATSASDLYQLGILAYHVLTGEGPHHAAAAASRVKAHLRSPPVRLRARGIEPPGGFQELLDECLAKQPAERPSASDVATRLRALTGRLDERVRGPASPPAGLPFGQVAEAGQPDLYLRLLGGPDLVGAASDGPSIVRQPKRLALLAFLAAGPEGRFRRRDSLIGLFWPDAEPDSARHSLRQALYVLRQEVGSKALRTRGDDEVGIDPAFLVCDVARFESLSRKGDPGGAMLHYGGDLLPGFYLDDAPEFERWLAAERLRLRRLAARCCWDLSETAGEEGDASEAALRARQAVDLDPFDERSLHRLIQLLDSIGDRAGAVAAFEHFARRLSAEYAIEPSPETRALVDRVRTRRS